MLGITIDDQNVTMKNVVLQDFLCHGQGHILFRGQVCYTEG
jgi:hypothetical protein